MEATMKGIIVFGAAGSGTTTIAQALAQHFNLKHIDVDEYAWLDTDIPKAGRVPHAERVPILQHAINTCEGFVMSGSICGWGDTLIPQFDLAVFVTTPTDIRLKRLQKREFEQFGDRILEGGDMYEHYCWFINYASTYDNGNPPDRCHKLHEEWIKLLLCSIISIDGTTPIEKIIEQFQKSLI